MIGEVIESRNVIAFPRPVSEAAVRTGSAQDLQARQARPRQMLDPPSRRAWRMSSVGDVTLRWVIDSILVGLAYAAAAHGPVSPDMLHEVHEMDRQRRRR